MLALISEHLSEAWASFDLPRLTTEPTLDPGLRDRLDSSLPGEPGDAGDALDDATRVLEASVSPARPLFAAYIGSTGLEAGVLAGALGAYDVNLAGSAGAAELLEEQALRWMAEFVGYPRAPGGVHERRNDVEPDGPPGRSRAGAPRRADDEGVAGRPAAVYCSASAPLGGSRGRGRRARHPVRRRRRSAVRAESLAEAVVADLRAGIVPVAVVATAGTTLTGAIDPGRDRRRLPVPRRLAARRQRLRRSGGRRAEPCAVLRRHRPRRLADDRRAQMDGRAEKAAAS